MSNAADQLYRNLQGITIVPRGFMIPRQKENAWLLQRAVRELTFTKPERKYGNQYGKRELPTKLFIQSETHLLVPKFWLLPLIRGKGVAVRMANEDGVPVDVTYREDMPLFEDRRRPQKSALAYAMENLKRTGGVLMEMPVGTGKTNVGLKIFAECKVKCLWVVHRHNLMEQAAERAREFIPGVRIGYMYADRFEVENCDIVFATVQSVGQKLSYDPSIFRQFGLIILDEAHHAAAQLYVNALFRMAGPRMVALTASPERADGLETITYCFFSNNKFVVEPTLPDGIELHIRTFVLHRRSMLLEPDMCDAAFRRKHERHLQSLCRDNRERAVEIWKRELEQSPDNLSDGGYSLLCSGLGRIAPLNALGVALIKKALITPNANDFGDVSLEEMQDHTFEALQDRDRSNVAMRLTDTNEIVAIDAIVDANGQYDASRIRQYGQQCERQIFVAFFHKALVDHFYKRLQRSGVPQHMIGRYYGECSAEERITSLQKRVVLLTYAMAEEGLDVGTANTLIMMGPRGMSSLQTVGRVLRDKMTPAVMPLVVHFQHKWCSLDTGMYYKRRKQFIRYPNVEKSFHIGREKVEKSQSEKSQPSILTFCKPSNETVDEPNIKEQNQEEQDLRIDECGALSQARNSKASKAEDGKSATNAKRKMSAEEKKERQVERKMARLESQQRDMQHLADLIDETNTENQNQTELVATVGTEGQKALEQ